jgi:hypothetical protein
MQNVPERRHPLYEKYQDDWDFYMQSFKGGDTYLDRYLATHRLENATDYTKRKKRAYYLNYCAPIAMIPSDFIFKKEATRPADDGLILIREDVDKRGTNIHEFMRRICTLSSIYGHVHILVDRPRPPQEFEDKILNGKTTKLDNVAFRPYATIIQPPNLLDWSVDTKTQELNWILLYEEVYNDEDFEEEREIVAQYRVWTKDEWIVYSDDNQIIDRGTHGLGFIPLITCYHKDIDYDMIGESMLKDVADANKAIFNWCSNIDEMIARQTFSQLICPDDGSMLTEEVDEQGRSAALKKVGSSTIFTFPADARHAPDFISPDTKQISTIWDMIQNHVREMFRMAGLVSAKTSLVQLQQRTGKAQEFEFLDMAVFFAAKAKKLEDAENKLNRVLYKWMGINDTIPERVHYPEKFDIISPTDIVELFTKVTLNAISGTLNKEMAKRLVHQVLPHAEDEVVFKIYQEIEENEVLEDPTLLMREKQQPNIKNPPALDEKPKEGGKKEEEEEEEEEGRKKERVPNTKNPTRRAKWREQQKK